MVTFPGEAVIVALITYATKVRDTMDPALAKRLDAILVQQVEDLQGAWRKIWIDNGAIKQ